MNSSSKNREKMVATSGGLQSEVPPPDYSAEDPIARILAQARALSRKRRRMEEDFAFAGPRLWFWPWSSRRSDD